MPPCKSWRVCKIEIVNPYSEKGVRIKIVTTIMSKNIKGYIMQRNKMNELDYYIDKFNNLYKLGRVINLSYVDIPRNVCNFLSLGDNYNSFRSDNVRLYKIMLVESKQIINFLNTTDGHKSGLRNQFNEFLSGHLSNEDKIMMEKFENVIMNSEMDMKEFCRLNKNIRFIKSDKSKKIVVMESRMYDEKMFEL